MHKSEERQFRRGRPLFMLLTTIVALIITSSPMTAPALANWNYNNKINSPDYKKQYGYWDVITFPQAYRINTIHAALLPTGKVLLVAGSGNNRDNFNTYANDGEIQVLKTAIFDPKTNAVKLVETPSDLFCSGHAFLQTGNLLVAGGTSGYELLKGSVKKPAGTIIIQNEDPDSPVRTFKKGTIFVSEKGKKYVSTAAVDVLPAEKVDHGGGIVHIHHSSTKIFAEAIAEDASYITNGDDKYTIEGLKGKDVQNIYGQGGPMTLNKQDYKGDYKSYEFDPIQEKYIRVGDMAEGRWYPSLPVLQNGDVLAVSGLDSGGNITNTTERYTPAVKTWQPGPNREFPTYPALFRTKDPNILFFSGSNAGYGPEDKGRKPGFWNISDNSFRDVPGLRNPNILETSASVMLPPTQGSNDGSQNSRVMVAGGGGVGESSLVTARTDVIDIDSKDPHFIPGPNLPLGLRYLNVTVTPWDEVFASGGSKDYRAKGNSYSHQAFSINPTTNTISPLADEIVSRSYHSGSLLLPDGRILLFGNDPLFADKSNTTPGTFEQRIEIFTPPQLFKSERPTIDGAQDITAHRGQILSFTETNNSPIKTARLIPPSTSTHVTNLEQRSVGVVVQKVGRQITLTLPYDKYLLPRGWYMLFLTNDQGTPSEAKMVYINE